MGGKVPAEEMSEERVLLLAQASEVDGRTSKSQLRHLITLLAVAAEDCPRMGCATCEFMAKHEADRSMDVGGAEAG